MTFHEFYERVIHLAITRYPDLTREQIENSELDHIEWNNMASDPQIIIERIKLGPRKSRVEQISLAVL